MKSVLVLLLLMMMMMLSLLDGNLFFLFLSLRRVAKGVTDLVSNGLLLGNGPRTVLELLEEARTKLGTHKGHDLTVNLHFFLLGTSRFVGCQTRMNFLTKQVIAGVIVKGRALAATEHIKLGGCFNYLLEIEQASGQCFLTCWLAHVVGLVCICAF